MTDQRSWIANVDYADDYGVITFPESMIKELEWETDDLIEFSINDDNSVTIVNLTANQRKLNGPQTNVNP